MSFAYGLKTGVYDDDVSVLNYNSLQIVLDACQASKYGITTNVEDITKLLVTNLNLNSEILNKMTITADSSGTDTITILYQNLRLSYERLAFLQHIRLLTKQLSDDIPISKQHQLTYFSATDKLELNASTPFETTGNTIFKFHFDVIAGYPNEAGGGLDVYEMMFKEQMCYLTNGEIDIEDFGVGDAGAHISGSF